MFFFVFLSLLCTLRAAAAQLDLPDPRIVIVSPTGSDKSSLANALLGCDPRSNDCTFNVCPDLDSCREENQFLKEEVKRLNDIIETNITTLSSLVHKNEERIEGNEIRIEEDEQLIRFNIERIEGNEKRIDIHETNITTNKGKTILNEIDIHNNKEILEYVVNDVESLRTAPIGSIIAWVSKPTKDTSESTDIPEGWVRCDGNTIPHPSIWAGQKTPDLNSAESKRFLRGGPDKDMLNMEDDQMQDHIHSFNDPGHTHSLKVTDTGHTHGYDDKYPNANGHCIGDGHNGPTNTDKKCDRYDQSHSQTSSSSSTGISVSANSHTTGITVGKVTSSYRKGGETRPANMNVIFIMRVY